MQRIGSTKPPRREQMNTSERPQGLWAAFVQGMDDQEGSWAAMPQRLRGRGDWLKERGRIKDAELMYDAATEIDGLRKQLAA